MRRNSGQRKEVVDLDALAAKDLKGGLVGG